MLTPQFVLSQDEEFLIASIRAPFAKVCETEISFEDNEFLFSSKPYFLRLYLPKPVVENDRATAAYDAESGKFTIKIPKKHGGEYFPGLDMLTKLLTPQGRETAADLVQELRDLTITAEDQSVVDLDDDDDDDNDQRTCDPPEVDCSVVDQKPIRLTDADLAAGGSWQNGYGFANRRLHVFAKLKEEIWEICELKDPDSLNVSERLNQAHNLETDHFDEDHFLCDLFENDEIEALLRSTAVEQLFVNSEYTADEQSRLHELPRKTYMDLSDCEKKIVKLSLVDILLAYVHTFLTFDGEENVEWGWMVAKMSRTLSSLVSYSQAQDVLCAFYRRALCFPLHRHFELAKRTHEIVEKLLRCEQRCVLRCLLHVHRILAGSGDYRYILNDLYVTDYCVWLQIVDTKELHELALTLENITVSKSDVGLDLVELESAGKLVLEQCANDDEEPFLDPSRTNLNQITTEKSFLEQLQKNFESCSDDEDGDGDGGCKENVQHRPLTNSINLKNGGPSASDFKSGGTGGEKLIEEIE